MQSIRKRSMGLWGLLVGAGVGAASIPVVLSLSGITTARVAAGSVAAGVQSAIGSVSAGSLFAAAQSAGAAGVSSAVTGTAAAVGGLLGMKA